QVHQLTLKYVNPSGTANPSAEPNASLIDDSGTDITGKMTSGQLGALLSVKNEILPHLFGGPSEAGDLNVLAKQITDKVNGVLATVGGNPLFTYDQTSSVNSAATLAVSSGFAPQDLVAADPGPNLHALQRSALASKPDAA